MADRFPLVANSSANQIQEIPSGDRLNLTGTDVLSMKAAGIVTCTGLDVNGNGDVSGNLTVGGVLTYEDVTNIDSVGLVTARNGLRVTQGGINVTAGISTLAATTATTLSASSLFSAGAGVDFAGSLREGVNITAGKLSDNTEINLSNGMVHLFTTAESTTSTPNIMSTTGINTDMSTGESVSVTIITTANASAYSANITVDSAAVTERWIGGSAPTAGGSSGLDIHAFTIIKTGDAAFTVIGNYSNAA